MPHAEGSGPAEPGVADPHLRNVAQGPAARDCAPGLPRPSPHFSLPTAGTASTANLIFVVINFCAEGEKKTHYGHDNNKNKIVFLKLKTKLACAVSQLVALRSRR